MSADDSAVEELHQKRGRALLGEQLEKRLKHPGAAEPAETLVLSQISLACEFNPASGMAYGASE